MNERIENGIFLLISLSKQVQGGRGSGDYQKVRGKGG